MAQQEYAMDTIVQILLESLVKKEELLNEVLGKTKEQEELLKIKDMKLSEWDTCVEQKSTLIEEIVRLDHGFESLYEKIRGDLMNEKDKYAKSLQNMQSLIQKIMEKSSSIQVLEERNKISMEQFFQGEKKQTMVNKTAAYVAGSYSNSRKNTGVVSTAIDYKK